MDHWMSNVNNELDNLNYSTPIMRPYNPLEIWTMSFEFVGRKYGGILDRKKVLIPLPTRPSSSTSQRRIITSDVCQMSGIKGQRYDEWHSRTFAIPSNCGFLYRPSIARPHPYATISIMASINQLRALARPSEASSDRNPMEFRAVIYILHPHPKD
eukprot:280262_1